MENFENVDLYIAGFPGEVQKLLQQLRITIKEVAPTASEVVSYSMPAYKLNGVLVYFAAHSKHIGFYPTSSGIAAFKDELSAFKGSKGTVQFPLDKPLPLELIRKIVQYRVMENSFKLKSKKKVPRVDQAGKI